MEGVVAGRRPALPSVWNLRTFCLITGASRGFGQQMVKRFAARLPPGSFILLAARDSSSLAATTAAVAALRPEIRTQSWVTDLGELNETTADRYLRRLFVDGCFSPTDFDQAIVVHNAASLGDVSCLASQLSDERALDTYWKLNLTSVLVLNSTFWKHFKAEDIRQRVTINISSICAKQPLKSWSIYCAGKAARDMLFSTMALEEPSLRVLSYAPGPLDTKMQVEARTLTADSELRTMFHDLHAEGRLLSCDQSLNRLIGLLDKNSFDSGSHIDYYDLTDEGDLITI